MALPKFSQKAGERIRKGGERKSLNFGNAEIPLPNFNLKITIKFKGQIYNLTFKPFFFIQDRISTLI